ncbi:MAG: lysoplasmalogenase [Acidobacteria bacterium]|nr:lysoplasmalogenase [Acidobacteriota bacterium]
MGTDALTFGRLRGFGATDIFLLLLSIVSSAIYFATQRWQPFTGSIVLKALSIATLALLAFRLLREPSDRNSGVGWLRERDNLILGAALSISCFGDIYLDLDPARNFRYGLVSFLIAHFIYILLFVRYWPRPLRPNIRQLLLAALVLIYSLMMSDWLSPSLGAYAKPVMLYLCTITAMVVTTILAGFSKPWIWLGAILFLISDTIIAADKFKTVVPLREYLVWGTYYLGQYGIAIGFLREKLGENKIG